MEALYAWTLHDPVEIVAAIEKPKRMTKAVLAVVNLDVIANMITLEMTIDNAEHRNSWHPTVAAA